MTDEKIVFVSTFQPETHYSRFLAAEIRKETEKNAGYRFLVYGERNPANASLKSSFGLLSVFDRNLKYVPQIIYRVIQDQPNQVHLQHEMHMYGGLSTALIFPLLVLLLRLLGKRVIVTFHAAVSLGQVDDDFLSTFSFPKGRTMIRICQLFFRYLYVTSGFLSNEIIVHSEFIKSVLVSDYGIDGEKVTVIPIGINESPEKVDFDIVQKYRSSVDLSHRRIVLFFGYLIRRKGLEYLIEAASKIKDVVPDFALVLAGGVLHYQRDYPRELSRLAEKLGMGRRILFTSFITKEEIYGLFKNCYLVVLPYVYSISSSLPLSFALEFNKPVLATAVGTLEEEVRRLGCGILVPPSDSEKLKGGLLELLTDDQKYELISANIAQSKKERTWKASARKTLDIYRRGVYGW